MANRYAVVTRAFSEDEVSRTNVNAMAVISHPILEKYAKKCHADFIVLDKKKTGLWPFHYEICQCYELFDRYERILNIDTDVLLSDNLKNLFDEVPESKIGSIYEDTWGHAKYDRRENRIKLIQEQFGDVGWHTGYINTGVFMVSRMHKDIFKLDPDKYWKGPGYDDTQFGFMIKKYGYEVHRLSYQYNHVSLFSMLGRNWLKSPVIHYAGRGFYRRMTKEKQMLRDLRILNRHNRFTLNFVNVIPRFRLIVIAVMLYVDGLLSKFGLTIRRS